MKSFEKEPFKNDPEILKSMALLMRKYDLNIITSDEIKALSTWKLKAHPEDLEAAERLAGRFLYDKYTSHDIPEERIEEIDGQMEKDFGLKSYIEEFWAYKLVKDFEIWKSSLENYEKIKKNKDRPYQEKRDEFMFRKIVITEKIIIELHETSQDFFKRITLTNREILKLFEFIKKYPSCIEDAIKSEKGADLSKIHTAYGFLKDIKDYFENTLRADRVNEFSDLRMDDPGMRILFSKIQEAFDQKKSA